MLHLVSNAINPSLGLQRCVYHWYEISHNLKERTRKRKGQVQNFHRLNPYS